MSEDMFEAKQKLLEKLGPNYGLYIQLLGRWFRGFITKEEFDQSCKQLVDQNFALEHNKFWLAFFHHCANNSTKPFSSSNFSIESQTSGQFVPKKENFPEFTSTPHKPFDSSRKSDNAIPFHGDKVRCVPNKVFTHMRIFVIAWEYGLDSADDQVSTYINLALQHFLKNIISEMICSKTAYRLRENRFKHAMGVRPVNPYLRNSLTVFSNNLDCDPYQIESNKMNSSLVDTHAYNDNLFPSRLYEAQALHELACSTSSATSEDLCRPRKRQKFMDLLTSKLIDGDSDEILIEPSNQEPKTANSKDVNLKEESSTGKQIDCEPGKVCSNRRLTLSHLLTAMLANKSIIPSQSLYSINLERIFSKI